MFDPEVWSRVPFHFWSLTFFIFGSIVGSFLNVCIHRMPRGESIVSPPSHCPHCNYSIPWFLNIPLVTWLYLRGKCKNCGAPISARYFLVELLTGVAFLACWLQFGEISVWLALVYCLVIASFIVATFIDFEHFIIPDEITIGGTIAGFICSFLVPQLHLHFPDFTRINSRWEAVIQSLIGLIAGGVVVYGILRAGKLFFGREKIELAPGTRIYFTETGVKFPEEEIPYEDIFYRDTDTILVQARTAEMVDRCYVNAFVKLRPDRLEIGEDQFEPEKVAHLEVVADEIIRPREAMGFGDVKFMAAIGAFLGWQAILFSLAVSSIIGSIVGITLIAMKRREWSSRLPYGPYIAVAAVIWIFGGYRWLQHWYDR